jgi:hypothetical protein
MTQAETRGSKLSRLDSVIRRLEAQRACLGEAARLIENIPGPVLELGLGNGRTYDHLRGLLPRRQIFVFDRRLNAHPDCRPDDTHMVLGEFKDTLPDARSRTLASVASAALAHADIGSGDVEASRALGLWLGPVLLPLMARGGIVVADQPLIDGANDKMTTLALPYGVAEGRYFMYRVV